MNQHAREVDIEIVVGSHAARKYLHPHGVPLPHSHHRSLPEGVVLKVVGVVAAGNDGTVVADQQQAVVALQGNKQIRRPHREDRKANKLFEVA